MQLLYHSQKNGASVILSDYAASDQRQVVIMIEICTKNEQNVILRAKQDEKRKQNLLYSNKVY